MDSKENQSFNISESRKLDPCQSIEPCLSIGVSSTLGSRVTTEIINKHISRAMEIWGINIKHEVKKQMPHKIRCQLIDPDTRMAPRIPPPGDLGTVLRWFYNGMINGGFPDTEINVLYGEGDSFKDGKTVGVAYDMLDERPYFILMCNGSFDNEYLLAHEIGHVLYYSNVEGSKDDPNPKPGDPHHNADPDNIMYPFIKANPVVTEEQQYKAGQSTLLGAITNVSSIAYQHSILSSEVTRDF